MVVVEEEEEGVENKEELCDVVCIAGNEENVWGTHFAVLALSSSADCPGPQEEIYLV